MSTTTQRSHKNFGEKVRRWRDEHNVSQEPLARRLEITRSYLSQIENGEPASAKLQARFRRLTETPGFAEELSGRASARGHRALDNAEIVPIRLVPLVSWAQAGRSVEYDELPTTWQKKVLTDMSDPMAFAVMLAGDSMEPRYQAGDVAFLEPSRPLRQQDLVIARLKDGDVTFKIYHRTGDMVRLASYNPAYLPFEVPVADIVWAYGVHSVLKIVNQ
ncbi:MAG: LexA family transcriptional regulator [Rhodospirillales bacterium]|nr:LexA family transcriptional regulator [Acetobacter sp.]